MIDLGFAIKQVESKEKDEEQLILRQDADYKIWNLSPTEPDRKGKVMVTYSDPRSFADELQKGLVNSVRTTQIRMGAEEGSDERKNISKLERLDEFCFERADLRLRSIGLPPLKDMIAWFAMIRGESDVRILNYLDENDELVADYLPLDRRWLRYEFGNDGLDWVGYKTYRSKADLKASYNFNAKGKSSPLIDYWGWEGKKVVNLTICEKQLLKRRVYPKLKRLPFIIAPVATRPPIVDTQGYRIAGFADSIYAIGRDLVPLRNKMGTSVLNWADKLANLPNIHTKVAGSKDIDREELLANDIIELAEGEKFEGIKLPEISTTIMTVMGDLSAQWQRATAPYFLFGDIPSQWSGTMMSIAKETEEKAYSPCLRNLNSIYTDMCYMIEEQIVDGGLSFEIKGEDKERKFYKSKITPVDIKRPHIIKVEHTIKSRFGDLQAYQTAQMAESLGLPKIWWLEHILKVQDPQALMILHNLEKIGQDPVLMLEEALEYTTDRKQWDRAKRIVQLLDMLGEREEVVGGQTRTPTPTRTPTTPATPTTTGMPAPMGAGAITPGRMM